MQIFTVISSRMNFFTNLQLPYMLLYCPHPALHHLPLLRTAIPLAILAAAGAASIVAGVPTSPAAEATGLLAPDLITTASKTPPSVTVGRALSSAIGAESTLPTVSEFRPYSPPLSSILAARLWPTTYCQYGAAQSLLNRFC